MQEQQIKIMIQIRKSMRKNEERMKHWIKEKNQEISI